MRKLISLFILGWVWALVAPAQKLGTNSNKISYLGNHDAMPGAGLVAAWDTWQPNLLKWSEDFTKTATWVPNSLTATPSSVAAPSGNGLTSVLTCTGGYTSISQALNTQAQSYTFSIWLKAGNVPSAEVTLWDSSASAPVGDALFTFAGPSLNVTSGIGSYRAGVNGWYQISITGTYPASGSDGVYIYERNGSGNSAGDTLYVWGAQLSAGKSPLPYSKTTDLQTAQNAAYTGARANLLTASENLGAAWVPTVVTIASNVALGPDGRMAAGSITTAASGGERIVTDVAGMNGGSYTFSVWVKGGTVTSTRILLYDLTAASTLSGGSTQTVTGAWTRISLTAGSTVVGHTTRIYLYTDENAANPNGSVLYIANPMFYQTQLGPELTTNGSFSADTNWVKGTGWTIAGGVAHSAGATSIAIYQGVGAVTGQAYMVSYTVLNYVSGNFYSALGGGAGTTAHSANGTYYDVLVPSGADPNVYIFGGGSAFTGDVDNVSIKQLLFPPYEPTPYPDLQLGATTGVEASDPTWATGDIAKRNILGTVADIITQPYGWYAAGTSGINTTPGQSSPTGSDAWLFQGAAGLYGCIIRSAGGTVIQAGGLYTGSAYVKKGNSSYVGIRLGPNVGNNSNIYATFNLDTQVWTNTGTTSAYSATSVGGGWYRISITGTATSASSIFDVAITDSTGNATGAGSNGCVGTETLYFWHPQLEVGSTLTPYQSNGSGFPQGPTGTAYATSQYVLSQTMDAYDPKVNLLAVATFKNSEAFTSWSVNGTPTITGAQSDPMGTTSAVKFVASQDGAGVYVGGGPVSAGNTYTDSVWLKGASGGEQIKFGSDTGGITNNFLTVTLTTYWVRYSNTMTVTSATAASVIVYMAGSSAKTVYAFGYQRNQGSVMLPYDRVPYSGLTMDRDFSVLLAAKFDGTTGVALGLADSTASNHYINLSYPGAGLVNLSSYDGTNNTSASVAVSASGYTLVSVVNSSGTITLTRLDTGAKATVTNRNPTGIPRISVGGLGTSTVQFPVDSLKVLSVQLYNRALSSAEQQTSYIYLKNLWASRGISIL